MTDKIKVERHGPVTVLRLDDAETMNALTSVMALELRDLLQQEAQTARALVLAGSPRARRGRTSSRGRSKAAKSSTRVPRLKMPTTR